MQPKYKTWPTLDFDSLNSKTVASQKDIARQHNLSGWSALKKADLIAFIIDNIGKTKTPAIEDCQASPEKIESDCTESNANFDYGFFRL